MKKIFSFNGRASRQEFWIQSLVTIAIFAICWIAIIALVIRAVLPPLTRGAAVAANAVPEHALLLSAGLVMVLCFLFYAWAVLAVSARRFHDLGRNFSLASFEFGPSIACGFRRGTVGPNAFGADPLEKHIRTT